MGNLDYPLAYAWQKNQGKYSEDFARKILNFEKIQKLKFNTVLDICCGSGNLLKVLQNENKRCFGTEIENDFVDFNKQEYPNIGFYRADSILDIDNFKKFDLITLTNRMINNLSSPSEISVLFERVYKHLNNGGVFIFDFYTKNQLKNWKETTKSSRDGIDQITQVETDYSTTIKNTFYIKNNTTNEGLTKYKKAEITEVKNHFNSEEIPSLIKKAQFRYLITANENFSPIANSNLSKTAYFIAIKRED